MKVYIETYGCWLNKAESEIMEKILREHGHVVVDNIERADVLLINTCAVRVETEKKILNKLKILRATGKKLIVAGCLVSARLGAIVSVVPNASLLAPEALEAIDEIIEAKGRKVILEEKPRVVLPEYRDVSKTYYVVPIASGCLGNCTFCIGKLARPRLRSYDMNKIVLSIERAVKKGAKEIFLSAQDVAAYGFDKGTNLVCLLEEILRRVKGKYRIRIGMMEPHLVQLFIDDLLPLFSDERLYRHVHLPVQSGDDKVLKLMNRKYTTQEYLCLIRKIRTMYASMSLMTDVIVGFPGEDDEAFRNTCELIEEVKPDRINIARYGIRPGTLAATMKQVPEHVKRERSKKLYLLARRIRLERNKEVIGSKIEALIVDIKGERALGRTENYKLVILDKVDSLKVGEFVQARIVDATVSFLIGKILE